MRTVAGRHERFIVSSERKTPRHRRGVSKRFVRTAYLVAGMEVVVAADVVVVVVAVVAAMASGAVLVVVVDVVLEVSSTTFGASVFISGFLSSGLLQATSEVARATRAMADVNFFILVCSLFSLMDQVVIGLSGFGIRTRGPCFR
jgi:hypothetical protein